MSGIIQTDFAGVVPTVYHYDEHTDELHIERKFDAEPLLEKIKRLRAHGHDGFNTDRSQRALCEIPLTILEGWRAEGVDFMNPDHNDEVLKRLTAPDLMGFRLDLEGGMKHGNIIVKGDR